MRCPNGLLAGVAAFVCVGVAGCGSGPAGHAGPSAFSATSSVPAPFASSPAAVASSSAAPGATRSAAAQAAGPAEPETKAGARAAAANFYRLYSAGRFAASWDLLSPTAQRAIPRAVWISVHDGCPSAGSGTARVIKSVLVFGNAAIVTEAVAGVGSRLGKAEDVFNYTHDHWRYSPADLGIYHHGAVAADLAAATALGFCTGRTAAPL
jgi:hypothetical protein